MKRKICVITGGRADYGLLRWLMLDLQSDPEVCLQIIATGMHLSPEFGLTYTDIEDDGLNIDAKVEMLLSSDTSVGISKSLGLGVIGFADTFEKLKPDLVLVLGDRLEIFSAASAAMVARIPIAHLHGGESSEGLIDEAIRHSITKMSHLHFVAAEAYRQRVIQLGEQPSYVFNVGGLGVDGIVRQNLLSKSEVEERLGFKFQSRNLMITFHPVSLERLSSKSQLEELLSALDSVHETGLIFTMPNSDTDGRILIKMIEDFVITHPNARMYKSLGQSLYFSCLSLVDGVIGNSSSGLTEAPTFKKGTINIGDRQRGRLMPVSVINCEPDRIEINRAISKLYSTNFQNALINAKNPYGNGGASKEIIGLIKKLDLNNLIKKYFYSLQ